VDDLTAPEVGQLADRLGSAAVLLDDVMPRYGFHERHDIWVPAAPADAYEAVKAVSASEVRLIGPFMRLRMLGRWPGRLDTRAPLIGELEHGGFACLAERRDEEVVYGAIGRFWSPTGNRPIVVDDFAEFMTPGYAKAAMNFAVRPEREGSRITTETRIVGTDADASRKFRLYWLLIRPGSGAIRRSWLKAIRRRLERTRPGSAPTPP
jgi:hypothetical protein